jgi:hypothetical protein
MKKPYLDSDQLRNRLKLRSFQSEKKLFEHHPVAAKFFQTFKLRPGKIRAHATNLLASGALAGTIFLAPPINLPPTIQTEVHTSIQTQQSLASDLKNVLPSEIKPLSSDQSEKVSQLLKKDFGLNAFSSLDGNRLNDDYGRMGAEQHLPRWPGDSAWEHEIPDKGITPGLGGWGYVGDVQTEKYYVAVQTLYLPNWTTDTKRLSDWYKHRRVVVINPANGKVIVAAVADAGPSQWTGKKFGGSPEVMAYLGINYGMQNHPVVLLFLDDKNNQVPLGPVEYNIDKPYDQNIL